MSEELKPCPFCGAAAEMFESNDEDGRFFAVICPGCGCGSRQHYFVGKEDPRPFAASAWNTRAETPQSIPSEREEIVKWLEETAGPGALVGDDVTRFMLGIAQSIRDGKHLTRQASPEAPVCAGSSPSGDHQAQGDPR